MEYRSWSFNKHHIWTIHVGANHVTKTNCQNIVTIKLGINNENKKWSGILLIAVHYKDIKRRGDPGFEPGTSRTQSGNHSH